MLNRDSTLEFRQIIFYRNPPATWRLFGYYYENSGDLLIHYPHRGSHPGFSALLILRFILNNSIVQRSILLRFGAIYIKF